MISPTVGRVVWFYKYVPGQGHKGPLDAHVCKVWSDTRVNLMVVDENGVPRGETSIYLVQDNEACPQSDYCCWMPYQKAVAAGTIQPTLHEVSKP